MAEKEIPFRQIHLDFHTSEAIQGVCSEFDAEEFNKGIKSMSFVAGQLMALQNAGIKPQNALEYLHATHSQDSDCECAKRVAELQAAVNEKAEKKNLIESKKNIA